MFPSRLVETLPQSGKARDQAGEAFGVSDKHVDKATKVPAKGSEPLVEAFVGIKAGHAFLVAKPVLRVRDHFVHMCAHTFGFTSALLSMLNRARFSISSMTQPHVLYSSRT